MMPTTMGQKPKRAGEGCQGIKLFSSPTPYAIAIESSYPETNTHPARRPLELMYNSHTLSV